jgi:FkbM family methyltransferase
MTTGLRSVTIKWPSGRTRTVHYRPGTSDEGVIDDVFTKGCYDLRRLDRRPSQHRHADILSFLERERSRTGKQPLIVDAGANIGATPIYFLSEFPASRVVAIEPDAANFELMRRNLEGADADCIRAAVASRPGRARIVDPGEGNWGLRTEISDHGNVACVTIDDMLQHYAATHFPFIAKIDIEGAEAHLFSANLEWVERTPIIAIELHDWLIPRAAVSRAFLRCVSALDRDFINVGDTMYSVRNDC